MKFILGILALSLTAGVAELHAQNRATGDWHGALTTPTGRLTLVIRIRESVDGALSGTLESIDQPAAPKMPLSAFTSAAGKLAFSIPMIGATYEGEWKDTEQSWSGTFRQGATLPLVLARGLPVAAPVVEGLDGIWRASLQRPAATLRLILKVRTSERGTIATLDSPDAGALGLEIQRFQRHGDSLRFHVPDAQVDFSGRMEDGRRSFTGRWTRAGLPDAQLSFVRDSGTSTARIRTQWPVTPVGYRAENVSFANPGDRSVTIAGTITIPEGPGPFPTAVLISGSGGQDRDESVFGHKPFAVLADHLSRRGIMVLRYDDRGVAASTGDHARATSKDFATDANAAVRYLLTRSDVDHSAIGFVGHSEGGLIGPIAAAENDRVAFVVLLAGPGTSAEQILLSQRRIAGTAQGLSKTQLGEADEITRSIIRAVRSASRSQDAPAALRPLLTDGALRLLGASPAQREALVDQYSSVWMHAFLNTEPTDFLRRLRVPVLAINGSLDQQVPSVENLAGIRVALARNKDVTIRELPGLNHFFQNATSGAVAEYADIAETFAPSAMEVVSGWIEARFAARRVKR